MLLLENLIQGSEEWLAVRKNKIGASDAPIIMGHSPWKTPYQLWCDKLGITRQETSTYPMRRGLKLEGAARLEFQAMTGFHVKPYIGLSKEFDFILASFDGLSDDFKTLVEIKCPGKEDHMTAGMGLVPGKYIFQLQHQMYVAELDSMYYFSYDGNRGELVTVRRDQSLIDLMLKKEKEFWFCLQNFIAPKDTHQFGKDFKLEEQPCLGIV